jgi:hypothetical protein
MEAKSELKYIFSNVNEWLKFAEAKHAGLVILNSGLIIGLLSSYTNINHLLIKPVTLTGATAVGLSILFSIASQFPVTQNIIFHKKDIVNPNIYFYGHLCNFDVNSLSSILNQRDSSFSATPSDKDMMNQIIINSKITQTKFTLFKFASYLTAFGCGLIGLTIVIRQTWGF